MQAKALSRVGTAEDRKAFQHLGDFLERPWVLHCLTVQGLGVPVQDVLLAASRLALRDPVLG